MRVLYNDISLECTKWLEQLCTDKLITDGDVVCGDFADLDAEALLLYDRVHLFAGIGGWDLALNEAGWGEQKVWTASLPCQPFSQAGKKRGFKDERHLLPKFLELVRQCKPGIIFGEQVERAIEQNWLDDLQTNLEAEGYSFGAVVLGAHSVGAAHIRQRVYWVAHTLDVKHRQKIDDSPRKEKREALEHRKDFSESRELSRADSSILRNGLGHSNCDGRESRSETTKSYRYRNTVDATSRIAWFTGRDGKTRPIESGIPPLVDGVSKGVVPSGYTRAENEEVVDANCTNEASNIRIRGYGNAIVIGCAVEFILANMDYLRYRQLL